jgi:SAM-dependent methyltransferase
MHCRLCSRPLFAEPLLRQPDMPAAAQHLPQAHELAGERGVDLALHQCSGCGLVQLANAPVPYFRDVIRASGISPEMRAFRLAQFGAWLELHGLKGRKLLEVGCGRGEYLSLWQAAGCEAHGIEHAADAVAECRGAGLKVSRNFIAGPHNLVADGPFDAFAMLNFLEHLPEAHLCLQGIATNLADGGIGMVEVPDFEMIQREGLFAEFIPDHLFYFTRQTLSHLLEASGFEVLACESLWHDYVLSATVRKRRALDLSPLARVEGGLRSEFAAFLAGFAPGRVAIWGAGHQALALLSLMEIAGHIRYVVDSAPFKQGRYTPATHLPIVAPERLAEGGVDAVIVLAASYSDEVLRILRARHGARFALAVLRGQHLELER